ncbi:SOS response-associated peptidase [Xanthobacter dioxanivorans]|uniref:Abasic site processing protein n=1 Tax=Xanthobacter dioxanivorans TaxID=2528964 RepID=A0A974PS48_9HYPH|nr:SOS response-associated peptidase [Xanthobacter dioxanivorans]QRG08506.1 SOS response-associated peptidase [Xanthobacter dioxanivorans]
MCGRFVQHGAPIAYAAQFGVDSLAEPLPNAPPRFNAAPTQDLMVVRRHPETGARHLSVLRWGLVPSFSKDASGGARLINARAESVAEKPSFRAAWRARRRCIVPAEGFYEWPPGAKVRQPFFIGRDDGRLLALAGLWEGWKDPATGHWLRTFSILTCAADPRLRPLHGRMPVILAEEDIAAFLGEGDPRALLRPYPGGDLAIRPVSLRVNAVRNEGADLMAPLAGETAAAALRLLEGAA